MNEMTEQQLREQFRLCQDVTMESHDFVNDGTQASVLFVYDDGLCDTTQIHQFVLPSLHQLFRQTGFKKDRLDPELGLQYCVWTKQNSMEDVASAVFSGQLLLYFKDSASLFSVNVAKPPERQPTASTAEPPVFGPGDSFVENLTTNRALIRKRLKTNSLKYEQFTIGKRSQAKVGFFYVEDIISPDVVEEVKKRLSKIDIDALSSISHLGHLLTSNSVFPLFTNTTRPDFVMNSLLSGRFALFVEGFPSALIAPVTLTSLLNVAEDAHHAPVAISLLRVLRRTGTFISIFLPGFWLAITSYHLEQLPLPLLANLAVSRQGVPLPVFAEYFLILFLFDILIEAGIRFPQSVGQTVTIIGGIVIGEGAIASGIAAPTTIVLTAIAVTAQFTNVGQVLGIVLPLLRYYILFLAMFLGLFGFFFGMFTIILYLANLKSFGIPYLSPLSPPVFKDVIPAMIGLPWNQRKERPHALHLQDVDKGEVEE